MSAVMESTLVEVTILIPGKPAEVWEMADWIRDALRADGVLPQMAIPRRPNAGLSGRGCMSVVWTSPAEVRFKLADVSREDAEAALRRAVQDAPGKVQSVEVNYENERGAHGW